MGGHGRHRLLNIDRVARIDDDEPRDSAHDGDVFSRLVAGTIAGGKSGQCTGHLDVQMLFCNHLMNKVVSPARGKCGVSRGERNKPLFGKTAGSGE